MQQKQTIWILTIAAIAATIMTAAIFGFFYAWVCSTMWGLDNADPNVAIAAMQAMNASVRNPLFALIFFGTPLILATTATIAYQAKNMKAATLFSLAGVIYFFGGMVLTAATNVPLNNQLALIPVPLDVEQATIVWNEYSTQWQHWNIIRTIASAVALTLACLGLNRLGTGKIFAQ
jgi:uncharacterized membrane protein